MMAKPELTKQLIAQTLKKLMLNTPLDKISVQEIVDACGLNRKTFYYHFGINRIWFVGFLIPSCKSYGCQS